MLLVVDLPSAGHRGGAHAGVLPQHRRPPPDRVVHRRPHPGHAADRPRGRGDDVHPGLVPLRARDGRGSLRRRVLPAPRRDDHVRRRADGRRAAARRLPARHRDARRLGRRAVRRPRRALRDRARHRRRRGPQGPARPRLDDQAALLGDRRPDRRPRRAGLRRSRLHARERRRADVPRAAGGADLGRRLGDPAGHRRAAAAQTRDRPRSSATPSPNRQAVERNRDGTKRDQAGSRGGGGGVGDGGRRGVLGRGLRPARGRRPAVG